MFVSRKKIWKDGDSSGGGRGGLGGLAAFKTTDEAFLKGKSGLQKASCDRLETTLLISPIVAPISTDSESSAKMGG